MKYKLLLNPSTTVDTVRVEYKLDNFMLKGAMRFSSFHADFHKAFEATFYYELKKSYAKTIVETSRLDISPALYVKLLTYQPTSASVEQSFSMLKFMKIEILPMHILHSIIKLYSTVEYLSCYKMLI